VGRKNYLGGERVTRRPENSESGSNCVIQKHRKEGGVRNKEREVRLDKKGGVLRGKKGLRHSRRRADGELKEREAQ